MVNKKNLNKSDRSTKNKLAFKKRSKKTKPVINQDTQRLWSNNGAASSMTESKQIQQSNSNANLNSNLHTDSYSQLSLGAEETHTNNQVNHEQIRPVIQKIEIDSNQLANSNINEHLEVPLENFKNTAIENQLVFCEKIEQFNKLPINKKTVEEPIKENIKLQENESCNDFLKKEENQIKDISSNNLENQNELISDQNTEIVLPVQQIQKKIPIRPKIPFKKKKAFLKRPQLKKKITPLSSQSIFENKKVPQTNNNPDFCKENIFSNEIKTGQDYHPTNQLNPIQDTLKNDPVQIIENNTQAPLLSNLNKEWQDIDKTPNPTTFDYEPEESDYIIGKIS